MNNQETRQKLFDSILTDHSAMVARICYMYGSDNTEREDLYQECMVNVWQGLSKYRGDAKLSTWLYRACINTCITAFRHRSRMGTAVPLDQADSITEDNPDHKDNIKELYRLISTLGDVDKAIIMMWLDEHSYEEISDVMGIPRNTVASKLRRIKEKLINMSNK